LAEQVFWKKQARIPGGRSVAANRVVLVHDNWLIRLDIEGPLQPVDHLADIEQESTGAPWRQGEPDRLWNQVDDQQPIGVYHVACVTKPAPIEWPRRRQEAQGFSFAVQ
jgi:hypothetical protein